MAKAMRIGNSVAYYCPACKMPHSVPVDGSRGWSFNGDLDKPTITPSVRHYSEVKGQQVTLCHYFVREGRIEYCSDNFAQHPLNGKTVDLPDVRPSEDGTNIAWNPDA